MPGPRVDNESMRLLLFVFAAAALFAADPPKKTFPFPYTQEDLPNGLRLVTIPTDSLNLVSIYIVVQTGSRNEVEPGKTGFAHLFEHLMFRGTEKYSPEKYQEVLARGTGTVPLEILERQVDAYIKAAGGNLQMRRATRASKPIRRRT